MDIQQILLTFGFMVIGSGFTFMAAWYWWQKKEAAEKAKAIETEHKKLVEQVDDLENKIALLTQSILPMNTAFQTILVRELTHYHTPVMDELLEKLGPPYTLTDAEEVQLSQALAQRTQDMGDKITEPERDAARILPYIMKRVKAETEKIRQKQIDKVAFVTFAEPTKIKTGPLVFPKQEPKKE